jgi:nucleoside-diphosphate-sugar epimerase
VILRVAGIYGPGRLPLARLREGTPVICPREAPPSNRIHAQDLAEVCLAAATRAPAGRIYNVSDGRPSSMTEYFYTVADLAGLPRPPCVPYAQAEAELGPGMWAFLSESRRLDSRRMLNELGITLRYPELADGLRASLADDQSLV